MNRSLARILVATLMLTVAAGSTFLWLKSQYHQFLESPLILPVEGHVLQIAPGTTASALIAQLDDLEFTQAGWQWKVLMRLEPPDIRTGEFRLTAGMQPRSLLELLSGASVIQYRLTIVEGWTFAQMLNALSQNDVLVKTMTDGLVDEWPETLPDSDIEFPEGWFLPETYQFTRGDSDVDILRRSHLAMKDALAEAWRERHDELPLNSPYELLILASIIEKETAKDDERNEVAGVFIRRLQKGMRLQTDPTVIYGMGENFDGDIRRKDLRTDTPYNTYTRSGLPPTPISLPGRSSLMAAGQPDDGDSLFFVADGKGGHTFSRTLEEHQKAVNKLIGKG